MTRLYNRQISVKVGDLDIRDSKVVFNVEKSLVGYPNKANIQVYNLKESSRKSIEEEGLRIELFAGYQDLVLLFSGTIVNVIHKKEKTEWITTIYAGDSDAVLNSATINKTLAPGSSPEQIFNELVGSLPGVTKGITDGLQNCLSGKRSLLRGIMLSGNVKDFLRQLADDCGFDFSVNDGVIETTVKDKPVNDVPPFVINQSSGMIGSPERTDVGVTVKNLLLPELKLGRRIQIKSITESLNVGNLFFRKVPPIKNEGIYRIDKLIHVGDIRGNDWFTEISGRVF